MSGTGYDLSTNTYSQDGRIFQIEYANKNITNAETVMGVLTSDGVILATEKIRHNPLLVDDGNRRSFNVTRNIGLMICGKIPDGRDLLSRAREEATNFLDNFGIEIPVKTLVERLANYVHAHTIYGAYRPYGCAVMISGYDVKKDKFELYMIENSGIYRGYYACANGKGREIAKTHMERIYKENISSKDALTKGKYTIYNNLTKYIGLIKSCQSYCQSSWRV